MFLLDRRNEFRKNFKKHSWLVLLRKIRDLDLKVMIDMFFLVSLKESSFGTRKSAFYLLQRSLED